ncbi:MAG: carboxypeptidase-like regulatory domain-containing protein [Endomicrobiales bacterium]|nr:carboxypeptidase-like regulatory domain-containing protein [Endomicrobiales bacterium]
MENFMTKKIKMWAVLSFFFVFCFFVASANAASFKNYIVDGSSVDWSSDELLGTENYSGITTSIYTTWSSTAIYFGLQDTPSCLHDYFIYISTSNSGGTNSSLDWNTSSSYHTLPFNAHYAFVYDSDTLKGLYKYDAATHAWVLASWSGSLISSSSTFGNIHELSIPMADLAITSATSIKVMVFTQDDVSNNVQNCFPEQNLSSRNPATFTKFFDFGTLSSGKTANTIPVDWRIYGLTADLDQGTHSGNLTAGFTPNNDNNQDNIYFDFLSAVDGSYVFTIDTNLDGVFDQNDYVVNSNIWADSYASPRVQWDGSKQNTGTPDPGQMMISKNIVDNNTTYYAQIKVTDSYGNTTTEQGSLGAWAVSGFATGKVIANGLPCAGAVVSVGKQWSESYYSGWDRYGVCDASGNFKVFGINADNSTYMLMAVSSPYASAYSAAKQIGNIYGVDFGTITLTKGVKIHGTVTNFYTGAPIADATITSYLETMSNSPTIWEQTNTDASGNYVDQVSSGSESITVSKDGFGNITANRTLLPGTTTQIDFVLAYGGSIYGQILSGTMPVANCSVSLYNSLNDLHDGSSSNSTQANSEGYYTFSNLAAGSYIVMANPSGVDSSLGFAYHTDIDVFENQTTNFSVNPDVNINLPPAVAIEGTVSDTGGPLGNINVYLMWSDTQREVSQYSVITDTGGYYYIGGVSTGTGMELHVSDKNDGHISQTSDLSFITHPGTNTKNFLLTLPLGGISGNIINNTTHSGPFMIFALPAGSPAPKSNPDFVSMATSTGHYGINVATGLVYGIGIFNEAEQQVIARTIGVAEGTLNADIIISTGVSVSGDVKNAASSSTISDASIEIISGAYLIGFSNSDSGGNFQVKYLPVSSTFSARVNVTGFNTWTGILSTASLNHIYLTPDPSLDTQKPVISFISPAINGLIGNINPTILATLSDGDGTGINVASTTISLDASPVTPSFNPSNGELSYDCSGLSEGSHTVYLSVRDKATIPNISNISWTFRVDTSTPVISFNCYDLDGNHDKHLNANPGSLEPSLQSDFSANENGNYSLYFDMNDNGVFDDGVDYFPASASSSVPYNLAYTTGTLGSSQWMNGSLYDKNGSWYGQISEGVHTLIFEFTDGLHIVKSTAAITVDRTNPTLQITHPAGSERLIFRNGFFDVDYSLSEDCYTIPVATTMFSASGSNFPLLGDQLITGENSVSLNGSPLNILTDNTSLNLTLSGYDLAGNYNSTEINTNCLVAPSTPTYFVAVASSTPRTAIVSWGTG